jgi:hypothetical protein
MEGFPRIFQSTFRFPKRCGVSFRAGIIDEESDLVDSMPELQEMAPPGLGEFVSTLQAKLWERRAQSVANAVGPAGKLGMCPKVIPEAARKFEKLTRFRFSLAQLGEHPLANVRGSVETKDSTQIVGQTGLATSSQTTESTLESRFCHAKAQWSGRNFR